ncbi:TPA: MFS transporter [Candidatus Bathyarchaeota archaeon]|nr:MFS transporter [Candidatus Bathyarchaeota archaeon]
MEINRKNSGFLLCSVTFAGQLSMVLLSLTVPIYAYMLGASPLLIGLIGGSGSLVYSLMPLLFGLISDRLGRKYLLVSSMFIHSFSAILYSSVYKPALLIPIKVVEWLAASSFWPSVEALIVEASEKPIEKTLRMFNVSWGSAIIVGPVIAGNLIEYLNVNAPFFLAASSVTV